jgi:uncharacterized membrane protein
LLLFLLGGILTFLVAYCLGDYGSYYGYYSRRDVPKFDSFLEDWFGFNNHHRGFDCAWPILLWFVPYLSVMLIRSIRWSIKVLNISKRARYGTAVCIAVLVLASAVVAYSVNVAKRYNAFTNQLSAVRGVHIGDSREDVKYRLGVPPQVLEEEFRGFRHVYTVLVYTVLGTR